MFGSEFSKHPEILLDSFKDMSHEYKKNVGMQKKGLVVLLQKTYVMLFGIPEIGFQIRSMFFKDILSQKVKSKPKKILDAGSGIGTYSIWACKNFPDSYVVGCEIDKNKLNFSNKFSKELGLNNLSFIYGDITKKLNGKDKYDLIINIDVLEHIKDYKKVLKNFYNMLSPKGYLYVHTPQPNQKRLFKQLENWHHEDHVREGFVVRQLTKELVDLRFKVIVVRYTFGFFGKLAWEINHILLGKSFILAGLFYPLLIVLSVIDTMVNNKKGLGVAILAQKKS